MPMESDIPTSSPSYQPEANRAASAPGENQPPADGNPVSRLSPGSPLHAKVLEKLVERLKSSEDKMSQFHARWQANERRFMAYINRTDFDKLLSQTNDKGDAPSVTTINVPYIYATVWTIVTYLVHTFCGQKPIFQVSSYSAEAVEPARKMETVLQFNADKSKLVRKIFQWMMDGQIYGVGIVRNLWITEYKMKVVQTTGSPLGIINPEFQPDTPLMKREPYLCYEGNDVTSINPYKFFPDPRVPMEEASRRGEFVFWRSYEGLHTLKKAERDGTLSWIDAIGKPGGSKGGDEAADQSMRSLLTGGDSDPGSSNSGRWDTRIAQYHQLDQGTIDIIPKDWGLGDEDEIERWIFTIANKRQIIQAEQFDDEHGKHPICVIEPNSIGYGFGQLSIVDMLGPIQDVLSWFVNSHMFNVRSALNNMFVVDPHYVEMQDLKDPGPGKFIRLKQAAMGRDVRTVLNQLAVQDVTAAHIDNVSAFMRLGDILSGVNDSLKGVQPGGRRSATESRITSESGASRQAALARMISAQGMTELAEMQASNVQQYQSMEFYLKIVGAEGVLVPIKPDDVQGNFYFPIHDGALPLDRVALLDVWKEIWMAVATNPQLAMQYNGPAIFEYMANLAGAKNLTQFKIQVAPPMGMQQMGGDPNAQVPVDAGLPGLQGGSAAGYPPGNGAAAPAGGYGA